MWKVVVAVLVRPWLWGSVLRFVPNDWWKRWPPNPMPPKEYLDFRLQTMYGNTTSRPTAKEAVAFLNWCRRMNRLR